MRSTVFATASTLLILTWPAHPDASAPVAQATRPVATAGAPVVDPFPGADLPTVRVHRYTMSGAIRPLLFWISRDDVGMARIVWRRGEGGARAYELLVGTDPNRAPRATNRWGFISEEVLGPTGSLLALMTGSSETSLDEETANAGKSGMAGDFRAIRARIREGGQRWQVARIRTPTSLTIHDLDAALLEVQRGAGGAQTREMVVSAGVRPGFLVAVAELIDRVVEAAQQPGRTTGVLNTRVPYLFGRDSFELQVREIEPVKFAYGRTSVEAIRTGFEIRTLATGNRTRFEVTCGTRNDMAGVPLAIEWQPRWWLRVQLRLDPPTATS